MPVSARRSSPAETQFIAERNTQMHADSEALQLRREPRRRRDGGSSEAEVRISDGIEENGKPAASPNLFQKPGTISRAVRRSRGNALRRSDFFDQESGYRGIPPRAPASARARAAP
jgi:hypothetical protein